MGVPYYFKYVATNMSHAVIKTIDKIPTILYIDFNGMIYEARNIVCSNVSLKDAKKIVLDYHICSEVVKLLEKVINSIGIAHLETVYIAIDGIAPFAKMNQQRQRRFKSAKESAILKQIDIDAGKIKDTPTWDSNTITPGTKFMERLNEHLNSYIETLKNKYNKIIIILDSSSNQGEGEHKLFKHLEDNRQNHLRHQKVIYGLDADLIILALLRGYSYTYLYREASYYPFEMRENDEGYLYMDANLLRNEIINEFYIETMDKKNVMIDYVFLTYLLGNDFLPNLFILKIQKGGFDLICELYKKGYQRFKVHLIHKDMTINIEFFKFIIAGLVKKEDVILKELSYEHRKFKPFIKPNVSEYEKKKMLVHFYPYMIGEKDTILLGENGWKERFYTYWLDGNYDNFMINAMVKNYVEGLIWILKYYTIGCVDWFWFYEYPIAPCLDDLLNYLDKYPKKSIDVSFKGDTIDYNIYNMYQLLTVLPKTSIKSIPKLWRPIITNHAFNYLYPTQFNIKTLYKRYYHDCYPILPKLEKSLYIQLKNKVEELLEII
jgi:5'-3' exonuclease